MTIDDRASDDSGTGVPGTIDDIPLDYGEEVPDSGGSHSGALAGTKRGPVVRAPKESETPGTADERELWRAQKALVEEDEKTGLKLEGFSEDEIPDILEAMGDDAADPLLDTPNGTSATGLWSEPEHGGFPERKV